MDTISHRILARHCPPGSLMKPGEIVLAETDRIVAMDTASNIARAVEKLGLEMRYRDRLVVVFDHHVPPCNSVVSREERQARLFFQDIEHFYDIGRGGISHLLVPEQRLCKPGDLLTGTDSHSCTCGAFGCLGVAIGYDEAAVALVTGKVWLRVPACVKVVLTGDKGRFVCGKDIALSLCARIGVAGANYKAIEFTGPALPGLTVSDRVSICNLAAETGAKTAIFETDGVTAGYYAEGHGPAGPEESQKTGPDEAYEQVIRFDVSGTEPVAAVPELPSNVVPVREIEGVEIHQAVIGSCSNGTIEDMRMAAEILRGRKVHKNVRLLVLPGTQRILRQMAGEGLLEILLDAGAIVGPPTCGPCSGNHFGLLAEGETCLATTNRNFKGRMGSPESRVYLANPAVTAASAVRGSICHPEEVLN